MKLRIIALIMMIAAGATMSHAQSKKKAASKSGNEAKTEAKALNKTNPHATDAQQGNPTQPNTETTRPGTGNGLAPTEDGKVRGTGEGSGPGSNAGVGLNSGIGGSTASSSGSGAVPVNEGASDGTNTKQRATRNMAGSPLPSDAHGIQKKTTPDQKAVESKSDKASPKKADEQKSSKEKEKKKGRG